MALALGVGVAAGLLGSPPGAESRLRRPDPPLPGSPRAAVGAQAGAAERGHGYGQGPTFSMRGAEPLDPPSLEDYLREARADPHRRPPLLGKFADRMADRMEAALASAPEARRLFEELRGCARDERGAESVRAICAVNAGRLARRYPQGLAKEFALLSEGLPRAIAVSARASLED